MFKKSQVDLLFSLLSVVGFLTMLYLLHLHYASSSQAVCDFSTALSCDIVNKSSYAEILRIPIALPGALFFLFFAAAFLFESQDRMPFWGKIIAVYASVWSVLFGSYLTAIEAFVLKAYCLFCLLSFTIFCTISVVWLTRYGQDVWLATLAYFRGES